MLTFVPCCWIPATKAGRPAFAMKAALVSGDVLLSLHPATMLGVGC